LWVGLLLTISWESPGSSAQEFTAKVVGVADGDTITVLRDRTQVRVRLDGIDCPESGQAFGSRAKAFTSELTFGKVVTVRPRNKDRYGRIVAEIVLADGRDVNHEFVRTGSAWWFRKYAPHDSMRRTTLSLPGLKQRLRQREEASGQFLIRFLLGSGEISARLPLVTKLARLLATDEATSTTRQAAPMIQTYV